MDKKVFGTFKQLMHKIKLEVDMWVNLDNPTLSQNVIKLIQNHICWVPIRKPLAAHKMQKKSNIQAKEYNMYCSLHDLHCEEKGTCATATTYKDWLCVKESSLPVSNAGLGLFTPRTFNKGDIILVYIGERTAPNAKDLGKGKRIKFRSSTNKIQFLDVQGKPDMITTYLGAHFINDPMFGMAGHKCQKLKKDITKKRVNAEF